MITAKFDPSSFFQAAENIALHIPANELFGLGRRTFQLPPAWGAIVTCGDGSEVVVPSSGTIEDDDCRTVLFVRFSPIDVVFPKETLHSEDGFECVAKAAIRVLIVPEREELAAFRSTVLAGRRVAKVESLVLAWSPVVSKALVSWFYDHEADEILGEGRGPVAKAVAEGLKIPAFSAGIALMGEPVVELASDAFNRFQRVRQDGVRRAAEVAAAETVRSAVAETQSKRMDHVSALLKRLDQLSQDSPGATRSELVRMFDESQRGLMFETMFAAGVRRSTRRIVIAAGRVLLFFDPSDLRSPVRRVEISGEAGSPRSVQVLNGHLWIGAATGVYRMTVDSNLPDAMWTVGGAPPVRGGFNSVCIADSNVFASHSELGLWLWRMDSSEGAESILPAMTRGAGAIREVQVQGTTLYVAVDQRILAVPLDSLTSDSAIVYNGSSGNITSLCLDREFVVAGNNNGEVLRWTHDRPGVPERLHQGARRPVESVRLTEMEGIRRLVFSDTSPFVHALVIDENVVVRYEAGGQTIRRIRLGEDILVGLNELRDRILLWTIGQPARPFAVVPVAAQCGHTVQDVCLVADAQV